MQAYFDPSRADDPTALPDVEVFQADGWNFGSDCGGFTLAIDKWYWQSCFPGCLPDSDPFGPFETEAAALADAQSSD